MGWNNSDEELWWRDWLKSRYFTTLFVDGNHDNHHLLAQYPVENWKCGYERQLLKGFY